MKANRIFVLAAVAGCLLFGIFVIERLRETACLRQAISETQRGRYTAASQQLTGIFLPGMRAIADGIAANIRSAQAADHTAEERIARAASAMHSRGTPALAEIQAYAQAVAAYLDRPAVDAAPDAAMRAVLTSGLPSAVGVRVEEIHSPLHFAKVVTLQVAEPPPLHRVRFARTFVRVPAQDGRATGTATATAAPDPDTTPLAPAAFGDSRTFSIDDRDIVSYTDAVALDWAHGIALSFAGNTLLADGTKSPDRFWHVLRVDSAGNAVFDDTLAPFYAGIDTLKGTHASGIIGRESGAQRTYFQECRTCPHVVQEFDAEWSVADGKYILTTSRIKASPYAAVASYVQSTEPEQLTALVDASGKSRRLQVFRETARDAAARKQHCRVLAQASSSAEKAEVRFMCPGEGEVAVSTIKRLDDYYLVNAYVPR